MANPVAVHTFDFVRIYLSIRTGGVPGSGVWANPTLIFDGTQTPTTIPQCKTMSAGGLQSTDPMGIVGTSGDTNGDLAFLGNGTPAVPTIISYAGQAGSIVSADYWEVSQGAFYNAGAYYLPHFTSGAGGGILRIITSTDGITWTECDSVHAPILGDGTLLSIQRIEEMLYFFMSLDGTDTNWSILPFNMTTGLYGVPFAAITITGIFFFGQQVNGDSWGNSLFQFPNGDFAIIYTLASSVVYRLWTKASNSWGSPVAMLGFSFGNAVMDPSLLGIHCLNYHDNTFNPTVDYNFIAYPSGAVTSIANAIPAAVNAEDGIGHSSIQNGMLFVPRDDAADFDNTVWVAAIPVTEFFKEELPVPPGESGVISGFAVDAGGIDYVNGDTGIVNGGVYPQNYLVTNAVAGIIQPGGITLPSVPAYSGGGYAVASGVATTPTSGIGSGLTIDITTVRQKTPSCAYMQFPNGYSLSNTLTLPCPLITSPAVVGQPFTETLIASGGTPPYTYGIAAGYALPPGLTLDPSTGLISGIPTAIGDFEIAYTVTDSLGNTAQTIGTCPIPVGALGSPCSNPVANPTLDSYLELRKVMIAWKKETHLPIRGKS